MRTHHNYDDCDKGAYTLQGDVDDHDDTWYPLHARSPRGRWGKTFQTKAFVPCSLSGWSAGLGRFWNLFDSGPEERWWGWFRLHDLQSQALKRLGNVCLHVCVSCSRWQGWGVRGQNTQDWGLMEVGGWMDSLFGSCTRVVSPSCGWWWWWCGGESFGQISCDCI